MALLAYSNAPASFLWRAIRSFRWRRQLWIFTRTVPPFYRHLPLWLTVHAQRAIAVLVTAIAIGLPLFRFLPAAYEWHIRRRLLYWYGQLKTLEGSIQSDQSSKDQIATRAAVDKIEEAVSHTRFPLGFANQVYDLRGHIDIVRRRLAAQAGAPNNQEIEEAPLRAPRLSDADLRDRPRQLGGTGA